MNLFWKNKFVFWNLVALLFVKAVFSYSGLQFASIMGGAPIFAKEEIVSQTNAFREFLGLGDLKENSVLDQAASQKLQNMISSQYFAHTSPTGVSPWYWIEVNKYGYVYAGENLAIGFLTAKDTVDAWGNSPTHRANLANPNFKEMGVAVAPAKIQNSEGFLVVQLFGTPKPAKPAVAVIKPSPTPVPPKATPTSSPLARSPTPSASVQSTAKGIATETPISVTVSAITPKLAKVSKTLNTSLIVYSLLVFLASLAFLVFYGASKELVIRTAVSLTVFILAVAIPVFQISRTALIL
ncbi:MAG: CAP domain-containing protein [Patescibacteria group bacterium]